MDKKAFSLVRQFIRQKPWIVLGMIGLMLALTFGEKALSDVLEAAELEYVDYGLAVIRLLLQTGLSSVLIYAFHKQRIPSVSLTAVDVVKLFVTGILVSLIETTCFVLGVMPVFLMTLGGAAAPLFVFFLFIPLGAWLFLRLDFAMNVYITGRDPRMFSCIRTGFRATKGFVGRYLLYNVKYLLFYFVIELALAACSFLPQTTDSMTTLVHVVDVIDAVFLSVFMPYRYLIKCGFYEVYLQEGESARA